MVENNIKTLQMFADTFGKESIPYGKFFFKKSENILFPDELPIISELKKFYENIKIEGEPSLNGSFFISLFPVEKLIEAQMGWRWIKDKKGNISETDDWSKNFVIFADRHGDVLSADVSIPNTPVYGSVQDEDRLITNSFFDFLSILCDCRNVEDKIFNFETDDDTCTPKKEFLDAIETVLDKHENCNKENFMYFFFG